MPKMRWSAKYSRPAAAAVDAAIVAMLTRRRSRRSYDGRDR